jgi:hypothetical protein
VGYSCWLFIVFDITVSCFFGLLIVTVVQSWQSGVLCSGLLYLFFDMARSVWTDEVLCIVSRDRFISVYDYMYIDMKHLFSGHFAWSYLFVNLSTFSTFFLYKRRFRDIFRELYLFFLVEPPPARPLLYIIYFNKPVSLLLWTDIDVFIIDYITVHDLVADSQLSIICSHTIRISNMYEVPYQYIWI